MLLGHRGLDRYGKIVSAAKTREGSGPFFNIFFARSYLLVLNSSLLHRPFLYSTVRCETDRSHFSTVRCETDRSHFTSVRC